jgi:prolyl oligopeptidase
MGWLLGYSPYHHVRDGTRYPAVLLTVSDSDTRVDPMHARKMCAALQHAATAGLGSPDGPPDPADAPPDAASRPPDPADAPPDPGDAPPDAAGRPSDPAQPVLLRQESSAGHGARAVSRSVSLAADTLAFAASHTGHPGFRD